MGFLNHIRVLNIKIISKINLYLIFLKIPIDKYKIKLNFMCISVELFYNFFFMWKTSFLVESNSSTFYVFKLPAFNIKNKHLFGSLIIWRLKEDWFKIFYLFWFLLSWFNTYYINLCWSNRHIDICIGKWIYPRV
jgi:hypothetical protein